MWMPGQKIMRDCSAASTARAVGSILVQGMIAVRLTIKPIKRAKPCLMGGQRNDIGEKKSRRIRITGFAYAVYAGR